jgi:hypothetical protein
MVQTVVILGKCCTRIEGGVDVTEPYFAGDLTTKLRQLGKTTESVQGVAPDKQVVPSAVLARSTDSRVVMEQAHLRDAVVCRFDPFVCIVLVG